MKSNDPTTDRKSILSQICDADNYLPIIVGCLTPEQSLLLKPRHMANFMSLAAELFISNYSMIGTAFERNNGLEIGFKAKLAAEKDNVEISFKPVDVFKDSASANLPDEDQAEFPFAQKNGNGSKPAGPVVEAEILQLGNSPDVLQLPAPKAARTADEQAAYEEGREEYDELTAAIDANPYYEDSGEEGKRAAYFEGWQDEHLARLGNPLVVSSGFAEVPNHDREAFVIELEKIPKKTRKAKLDAWLVKHGEENFLKLADYKIWNGADAHLLKAILVKCREIDPTGDY